MNAIQSKISTATFLALILGSPIALATPASADVRIVALGDSGIRGKGVSESDAYPAQLERALRARGHKVTVTNEGINGDTTAGVLARIDSAVPSGTDIVVLKVGINDIVLHHLSQSYVAANQQEIIRKLRGRGVQVYLIKKMGDGMPPSMHVEAAPTPGKTEYHLNGAGYAVIVGQTLPAIEAMVRSAEKRHP